VEVKNVNRGTYKQLSAIMIAMVAGAAAASGAVQEDIVLQAPDFTVVEGHWSRVGSDTGSGSELTSPDGGWSDTSAPASHPGNYVEATFDGDALSRLGPSPPPQRLEVERLHLDAVLGRRGRQR
jgi:hypothetical protein